MTEDTFMVHLCQVELLSVKLDQLIRAMGLLT